MTTPRDVLHRLLAHDATRPRLTWYGGDGERVELSARVLENWVAKAANLLLEEADLEVGGSVRLDLPRGHWRGAYWALATWSCGATLRLDDTETDAFVTSDAEAAAASGATLRVLVTPGALARSHPGEVPVGVVDEAAELATYPDRFVPAGEPSMTAPALVGADGRPYAYAGLVPTDDAVDGVRRHLDATALEPGELLRALLATWAARGSVVVTCGVPEERLEGLLASEAVDFTD